MWSKIKLLTLPLSIKLTILYAVILSCILLLTSLLTLSGLYYMLYHQAEEDVHISEEHVRHYLEAGNPLDSAIQTENLILPGVNLKIWNQQNQLILEINPYTKRKPDLNKPEEPHDKDDIYEKTLTWPDNQTYTLQFQRPLWDQLRVVHILFKNLMLTNLVGLFIAIGAGIFMSRKILHPIRDIITAAKKIEVTDLGKRLPVSDSRDELRDLAQTFNHMLNKIQKAFEQQRRFTADASHELRTPITIIDGYANMLDRWGKQDPIALDEGIEAIKSEAANMNRLIEKLLFLARADQGKLVIKKVPINMATLIQEVIQETHLIAPKHQVLLKQNDLVYLQADATLLKQMLRIFIDNSIKYTPPGGKICLTSRKAAECLEISIQDTGCGIPQEDQPKVFQRFYRVDKSRAKATGGTGLGLSIARWISNQHQSTLQLASTDGKGTTVTIKIPIQPPN